jgi:hypothetical protein
LINSSKIFYFRKLDSSLGRILSSDVCTHGDEVIFMFNLRDVLLDTVYTVTRTSVYQVSSQTIFKSLAANSFLACGKTSAHGDPNPDSSSLIGDKWLPLKGDDPVHLDITSDGLKPNTDGESFQNRSKLWEKIYNDVPPTFHREKSKTFKDTKLYKKSKDVKTKQDCNGKTDRSFRRQNLTQPKLHIELTFFFS